MSKQDAAMSLSVISGFILMFLWLYGLIVEDAPRSIKTISQVITGTLYLTLMGFIVYCIYVLVA